jgi:hypothetical protein
MPVPVNVIAALAPFVFVNAATPPVFDASGARRVIGPDGQPVPDDQEGAPASPEAPSPQPNPPR